jgi:hypothetical protein
MDNPFSPWHKKYTRTWPLLPSASACTSGRRTSFQNDLLQKDKETTMKHIATVALMLNLGVAGVYAQDRPVMMTFSGTAAASTINLGTGTPTSEYNFGGDGALGPFTFRTVSAGAASPQQSSTCPSPKLYFPAIAGAGVFRFQDGSLLKVHLTQGSDCIDLAALQAVCIRAFQITGGTGRFKDASGMVTFTETLMPVVADANNNPVFFAVTGEVTGTVSGVAIGEDGQDARR